MLSTAAARVHASSYSFALCTLRVNMVHGDGKSVNAKPRSVECVHLFIFLCLFLFLCHRYYPPALDMISARGRLGWHVLTGITVLSTGGVIIDNINRWRYQQAAIMGSTLLPYDR